MPWTPQSFASKHNHSLMPDQSQEAAKIANAVLQKTGDEASAIRIANAQAGRMHPGRYKSFRQTKGEA